MQNDYYFNVIELYLSDADVKVLHLMILVCLFDDLLRRLNLIYRIGQFLGNFPMFQLL